MAKLKTFPAHDNGQYPFDGRSALSTVGPHNGHSATFIAAFGDGYFVLTGEDLQFDADELVGGRITGMTYYSVDDVKRATISDVRINAANITYGEYWPYYLSLEMLRGRDVVEGCRDPDRLDGGEGNDVIFGRGGADSLQGGYGRDRLTGNGGGDGFYFYAGDEHDVITDFNSKGADHNLHDKLYAFGVDYTVEKQGDDLLVEFDNGASVTLLDFKKSELDAGDIVMFM